VNVDLERVAGSPIVPKCSRTGFTLIELIVVLTVLALLLTIAVPRYFSHIEHAKEATLKQDLSVMRDAIDKFHGDKGRYPDQLDELVSARYIRTIPVDPITESASTLAPTVSAAGRVPFGNVTARRCTRNGTTAAVSGANGKSR